MSGVLIDTNLLVYLYDVTEPEKRRRAGRVLQRIHDAGAGVSSAQVLSEFYNAVTRKLEPPLSPGEAEGQLRALARVRPVIPVTAGLVLEAAGVPVRIHSASGKPRSGPLRGWRG